MAYRTDDPVGGENDQVNSGDQILPTIALNVFGDYPKKVGPITIERDLERLSLRRENAGGLGMEAYVLFAIAMLAITIIGFMGMMQGGQSAQASGSIAVTHAVSPTNNHFALLWVISVLCLLIGAPLYIKKAYGAALVFTFDKVSGFLSENKSHTIALRRIECVAIQETRDPDERFLYLLKILHTDGHELLLYNGYEERDVITLAEEIARFLNCRSRFTGVRS